MPEASAAESPSVSTVRPAAQNPPQEFDSARVPFFSRPSSGIWLTLATIVVFEIVTRTIFPIPRPTSIYFLAIAAATTIGGMRVGLVSSLLTILVSVLTTSIPGHLFHLPPEATVRVAIYCLTAPATAVIIGGLRKRNERLAWERTERARAEERAVAALMRERRIVATLQNSLLLAPPENAFPGLTVATRYEAASDEAEVGGDFFDAFALDDLTPENASFRVALLVGDVSGKGLAAASRTAEIKYTLRAMLREYGAADVGQAVARANRSLVRDAETESPTGEILPVDPRALPSFACLSLAIVDTASGETTVVVAGMEPPLIVRAETGKAEMIEANGIPLGIEARASYAPVRLTLYPGDLLIFATDGVTEARDATGHHFFGTAGLQEAAQRASHMPVLDRMTAAILESARSFTPQGRLKDDACLLIARRL